MKRYLAVVLGMLALPTAAAYAGVDVNLSIGVPAVVVAPPPVRYYPAPPPAPAPPPVTVVDVTPNFIYAPDLGCYVSVDAPYDMVYTGRSYYLYRDGYWYRGASYAGPWVWASPRRLPVVLRQYRYDQIRAYRDREYRVFAGDREHYRGRWHRPVGEWREHERFAERREHGWDHGRDRW